MDLQSYPQGSIELSTCYFGLFYRFLGNFLVFDFFEIRRFWGVVFDFGFIELSTMDLLSYPPVIWGCFTDFFG